MVYTEMKTSRVQLKYKFLFHWESFYVAQLH